MVNLNYYGQKPNGSTTFLEFGSIDLNKGKKEVYDIRKDQQAYDWYMLGRYANDIYLYDKLLNSEIDTILSLIKNYLQGIHHRNDLRFNFYKLFSLMAVSVQQNTQPLSFYEMGQTLFGCIEGMLFGQDIIQKIIKDLIKIKLETVNWYGVDISPFFNYLSNKFHPNFNVYTGETFEHLPKKSDVFFAKGVTMLYAVSNAKSILDLMLSSSCGFFDYSFSMNEEEIFYIPTGKQVTYVGIKEFLSLANHEYFEIIVNQNTVKYNYESKRIYVECFYGSHEACQKFIETLENFEQALFQCLNSELDVFEALMNSKKISRWVPLKEYKVSSQLTEANILISA